MYDSVGCEGGGENTRNQGTRRCRLKMEANGPWISLTLPGVPLTRRGGPQAEKR